MYCQRYWSQINSIYRYHCNFNDCPEKCCTIMAEKMAEIQSSNTEISLWHGWKTYLYIIFQTIYFLWHKFPTFVCSPCHQWLALMVHENKCFSFMQIKMSENSKLLGTKHSCTIVFILSVLTMRKLRKGIHVYNSQFNSSKKAARSLHKLQYV